jgi:hypothetical protein
VSNESASWIVVVINDNSKRCRDGNSMRNGVTLVGRLPGQRFIVDGIHSAPCCATIVDATPLSEPAAKRVSHGKQRGLVPRLAIAAVILIASTTRTDRSRAGLPYQR